jgi:AcrR family transcriptional regulator
VAYDLEVPVPEGVRTKRRILETALELFCAHGYEGASLRQLADRMEFTPAALYYHFDSKVDILQGVVTPLLNGLDEVLADALDRDDSGGQRLLLERVIDTLLAHRAIVTLLASDVSAARAPGISERLTEQNQRLVDALAGPDPDTERLVRITAALGAVRRPLLDLRDVDLSEHREAILDSALAALNPPAKRRSRATPAKRRSV